MKKRIGRRLVSLLLTVVTILTMLPAMTLPALADKKGNLEGLTDPAIELSFNGNKNDPWEADDQQITGSIKSKKGKFGLVTNYHSTLTIKNKTGTKAMLSFNYTVVKSNGTIKVNGSAPNPPYSFSKEIASEGTVSVYIESGSIEAPTKITMTDIKLVPVATATVTFQPAEHGSYTVNGETITEAADPNTQSSLIAYKVVATPDSGYQFMDWYDVTNKKSISRDQETELNIEKDCTIKARFTTSGLALFETGGLVYDDLTDAITAASGNSSALITQVGDGTISGSYTIPNGVTLLIPFNEAGTLYTDKPVYVTDSRKPSVFRKLTMAPDSSITVNGGAISVGGKHFAGSAGSCCKATGPYGQIIMQEGSSITLNKDAKLYAWGYITGDGQITANSGATVYEYFQVTDWRGGNAVLSMVTTPTNHVFPFSQYYVQNIEAPLTIQNGATEKAYFSVTANDATVSTSIDFIGSTGLFQLKSGSITKKYVPATGRTEYTTNGTACLDHLAVTMKLIVSYTIDSKNYVLPINGNMILNIASGKVTSNYDLCLLPGVQINIAKDAELEIVKDAGLYVYDSAEWGDYCQCKNKKFADVDYSPTLGRHVRTEADLVDAKINVNGTLTAAGSVYSTQSGANICSSEGSGKFVQQSKPGTESTTRQATQKGSDITYVSIPITPAQLKNADSVNPSYTPTAGSVANDTFTYCTCPDCGGKWTKNLQVAEIVNGNGEQVKTCATLEAAVNAYSPDNSTAPTNYIKLLHNTTEDINISTRDIYLDLNGRTVTGDISVTDNHKLYGMDSSAKADYTTAPKGKIVGTVTGCAPTYQTPGDTNDRYVAISVTENGTSNLSFHHFNISVTGYRFELTTGDTPKCALFFIGKFQGDAEAKKHLTKLGFTLTDIDKTEKKYGCTITGKTIPLMPTGGGTSTSEVVQDADGAYFFEAYLTRDINKKDTNTYTKKFSAIAQATFDNGGTQQSDPQNLSFQDAWTEPKGYKNLTPKQQEILNRLLTELDIPIPK